MFSSCPNYTKLKTNLRLAISRLKLLEKKKMEIAQKSRKEIADYIEGGKVERAKIRVEHIIREDYMVEAMEMLEMFCDLLVARMGLIAQMKAIDSGLEEAVSTILWAGPRMAADVPELNVICEQLSIKYGKEYAHACRDGTKSTISEKFKHRMGVQAPPKVLVEKYLIEISNNFHVAYEPDESVLKGESEGLLIDFGNEKNNLGGPGGPGMNIVEPPGFKGFPAPPVLPPSDFQPFNYKYPSDNKSSTSVGGFVIPPGPDNASNANSKAGTGYGVPFSYNIPVDDTVSKPINYPRVFEDPPSFNTADKISDQTDAVNQNTAQPKPSPASKMSPPGGSKPKNTDPLFPELPSVPDDTPYLSNEDIIAKGSQNKDDDIDFDDLTKRFENLKKKK